MTPSDRRSRFVVRLSAVTIAVASLFGQARAQVPLSLTPTPTVILTCRH